MSNNKLSDQIISCVNESGLNDYDQRSAIGMARSWLENGKPITWNPEQVRNEKRDQLAKDLVALMDGQDKAECIEALSDARRVVNAPFQIETSGGSALQKPGAARKAREVAKA